MAFDQPHSNNDPDAPESNFLDVLQAQFEPGSLTSGLREDLETLASLSDTELAAKGLSRARVERAVRRKYIQSLYG